MLHNRWWKGNEKRNIYRKAWMYKTSVGIAGRGTVSCIVVTNKVGEIKYGETN